MLKLYSLEVLNYTNFNKIKVDITNNLTVMLGANGSGKSNFIKVFTIIKDILNRSFIQKYFDANNSFKDLIYLWDNNKNIYFKFIFEEESEKYIYEISLKKKADDENFIEFERLYNLKDNSKKYLTAANTKYSLISPDSSGIELAIYKFFTNFLEYNFYEHNSYSGKKVNLYANGLYLKDLWEVLFYLKNNFLDSYTNIINILQMCVPVFKDFTFTKENNGVKTEALVTFYNKPISNSFFSKGSIQLIHLVTMLNLPVDLRPNLVTLEEPEIGLHPYAIDVLGELINTYTKDSSIILNTQSFALVDNFSLKNLYIININKDNGESNIKYINEEEFSLWLKNYSVAEIWKMNIIGGTPL